MKKVLLVAFQYPPFRGSSGVQRTLRFSQHLADCGWQPIVLSVDPRAYELRSDGRGNETPEGVQVHRAFGLDAARQLSIMGRYPRWLALPDRWATWRIRAVPMAIDIIRNAGVQAIWSTFPIATAHRIGLDVARRTGLPWIAEFRDPMWQGDYPPEPATNRAWLQLERQVFEHASAVVVTTKGARNTYLERFPAFNRERIAVIENGYDEETFQRALQSGDALQSAAASPARPFTLLHSGIVYRSERDPSQLFAALASLKARGAMTEADLQIVFRASGEEAVYRQDIERLGISDIVRLEPAIDYLAALREMLTVDGLLILQASNCNAQVPAKLYEYVRAQRPILALTDPRGDTAAKLEEIGTGLIAPLDSAADIEAALMSFVRQAKSGAWRRPQAGVIHSYSRQAQTQQLAALLNAIA